jgi:hypothetical protein
LNDEVVKMKNEKRLIYLEDALRVMPALEMCTRALRSLPTVDAVEVAHIEEVKQEILQTLDTLIATHRDISNSRFANSEKYLDIPESSNDYYGIYANAMEVARRLVNAALTGLCDNCGAQMEGYAE